MHPDDVLRTPGLRGEVGDGQRRGGRRQDGTRLADAVQVGEQLILDADLLGDRLDHDVDVTEGLALGRAGEAAEDGVRLTLVDPTLVDLTGQVLGDLRAHRVDLVAGAGHVGDGEPVHREDLDDAAGHRAGADDADGLDRASRPLADLEGVSSSATTSSPS